LRVAAAVRAAGGKVFPPPMWVDKFLLLLRVTGITTSAVAPPLQPHSANAEAR